MKVKDKPNQPVWSTLGSLWSKCLLLFLMCHSAPSLSSWLHPQKEGLSVQPKSQANQMYAKQEKKHSELYSSSFYFRRVCGWIISVMLELVAALRIKHWGGNQKVESSNLKVSDIWPSLLLFPITIMHWTGHVTSSYSREGSFVLCKVSWFGKSDKGCFLIFQ